VHLLGSLGRPAHLVGHSRGGGQATDAALWAPECVRKLVNMDGFGPPPEGFAPPGVPLDRRPVPPRFRDYLDSRRKAAQRAWRPYPSLEDLVERRRQQNPRLSREWLRYFLYHGARQVEGGWIWKTDPEFARGFGPWRPEWIGPGWKGLRMPTLAITGSEPDSWRLDDAVASERLAYVPELERATVAGAGHFVHMERPRETADVLLGFLEP
jgi:pimeloyl-ACP methyl ester carboxylesterase